ncbi:chromosomal replication initiator protein DnaA [Haloglycomyces albus]|uniref:chromosomal replication initiator protein DnaA n=1 Tax=Haloglycomyces albus TaxID=526067 RepID=UPI0005500AB9|nr:chromosomal replication initiator protein DnaA [Haloglycomyces albus]
MTDDKLASVWADVTNALTASSKLTRQQQAWMRLSKPVISSPGIFIIETPDKIARSVFEGKLRPLLTEALSERLGQPTTMMVTMQDQEGSASSSATTETTDPTPAQNHHDAGNPPTLFDTAEANLTPPPPAQAATAPTPEPAPTASADLYPNQDHTAPRHLEPTFPPRNNPQPDPYSRETEIAPAEPRNPNGDQTVDDGTESATADSDSTVRPTVAPPPIEDPDPDRRGTISEPATVKRTHTAGDGIARLNPRYNFDTFVIGSSNRFAHAASFAVAESPAMAYNPLFLYGGSGLGKTHLLHAIGHYAVKLGTAQAVRYVTTEEFTNEFINSVTEKRMLAFQKRYRDVDILLIDDIQFLVKRERTQEEFFHTFNALHNANKQLVISSDRSPKQLQTLEDRLRTRFEWGLLADIQPPDLETRIAILRKKAVQDDLNVPFDAVEYIATQIHHSIRELEGALIRVTAYASLNQKTVDKSLAAEVLSDYISEDGQAPEVTVEQILKVTTEYFDVSQADLKGTSRSRILVNARQVAMYLCRELTDLSLPRIGQAFGGRDHTTVMHATKKIRKQMAERRPIFTQISELTNKLKQSG